MDTVAKLGLAPSKLAGLSLLWASLILLEFVFNDNYLGLLGDFGAMLLVVWCLGGLPLLVLGIGLLVKRMRMGLLVLVNLLLVPFILSTVSRDALIKARWQHDKPAYERALHEALAQPLDSYPKPKYWHSDSPYTVRQASKNLRLLRDTNGHIRAAFVLYRIGLDNGAAYVYDPQDNLPLEFYVKNGQTKHRGNGLGGALTGIGELCGVMPLGDHWYRCAFT